MQKIGLTGGIGSGKSSVADMFHHLNIPIIDADVIARQVVEPGSPVLESIQAAFGSHFVQDGELMRQKLKTLIFHDADAKAKLEQIMHPVIRQTILNQANQVDGPYCIIVVPLLAENHQQYTWLDKIIVVDVEPQVQQARTVKRDKLAPDLVNAIIKSQASRDERLAIADVIIDNNQTISHTQQQVESLHQTFISEPS